MPGSGSGQILQQYTFQEVQAAAVRDGLEVLNPQPVANDPVPGAPGGDRHLVALVVDPGSKLYIVNYTKKTWRYSPYNFDWVLNTLKHT